VTPDCVIFNPAAGRGRARRLIARLERCRGSSIVLWPTDAAGHAADLAQKAAEAGYRTVIAAGGDGTVHEVANGLIHAGRREVTLAVWPIGSANDYAFALGVTIDWPFVGEAENRLAARPVDVGRVTAGDRRCFFVNGLGIGFNGAVTFEARRIKGLRGMALYGLAFLKCVIRHFEHPRQSIMTDGREHDWKTLALTINLGKREGGFLVTPRAILDDGLFDFVHAGPLTRWQALTMLPRMAKGTLPEDNPLIVQGRSRQVRIRSASPLWVHTDGELFFGPDDGVTDMTIEVIPRALNVLRRCDP
jgi:YegS/Rv2252/BmrU family lipid kinase